MTIRKFNQMHQCYKDNFDLEMRLNNSNTTYSELVKKSFEDEEWL